MHAAIDDAVCDLRVLLEWVEREEAEGVGEAPYPPNFPKMPGEPKRVQPSRRGRPSSAAQPIRASSASTVGSSARRGGRTSRQVHAAGSLSGRKRSSFVPWRKRLPCTLS